VLPQDVTEAGDITPRFANTEMREVLTWPLGTPANVHIGNSACIAGVLLG
jgi:hypothetical protein